MEITIGWPQGIIILLWLVGLIIHGIKHGENKTGKYNVWHQGVAIIIVFFIFYWGGFFG